MFTTDKLAAPKWSRAQRAADARTKSFTQNSDGSLSAAPISLPAGDQVYLVLYGTG